MHVRRAGVMLMTLGLIVAACGQTDDHTGGTTPGTATGSSPMGTGPPSSYESAPASDSVIPVGSLEAAATSIATSVPTTVTVSDSDNVAQLDDPALLAADAERLSVLAADESDLEVSLLVAAQAHSMADTAITRSALLDAVQRIPAGKTTVAPASEDPPSKWFALTSDGSAAVSIRHESDVVAVVDLDTNTARAPIATAHIAAIQILPSGERTVITTGLDRMLRRWDVATGALLAERAAATSDIEIPLAVTADFSAVYVQTGPTTILPLDVATLQPAGDAIDIGAYIGRAATQSPNGHYLAVATFDPPAISIIDLPTGERRSLPLAYEAFALAFSPDSSQLVAGIVHGEVLRIDPATVTLLGEPVAFDQPVGDVIFAPDGSQFVTGEKEGIVRLWNSATGAPAGTLRPDMPHTRVDPVWAPDGFTLLLMYDDASVDAFDTRPTTWLEHACRAAARQLAELEWAELLPDRPYEPACG